MEQSQNKQHIVDILFVLTLFCIFTASALLLVIMGARIYKSTVNNMNAHYESRTSESYLTEKFRQNDIYDSIKISTLEGNTALCLYQTVDSVSYCTYLYYYNGSLYELLVRAGSDIGGDMISAGNPILQLSDFSVEHITDTLYEMNFTTTDGEDCTFFLHSRCN